MQNNVSAHTGQIQQTVACTLSLLRTREGVQLYIKSPLAERLFRDVFKLEVSSSTWFSRQFYLYDTTQISYNWYLTKKQDLFVLYSQSKRVANIIPLFLVGIENGVKINIPLPINIEAVNNFCSSFQEQVTGVFNHFKQAGMI